MNTDIQAKINADGEAYGKTFPSGSYVRELAFIDGANHILSNPELLREQMESFMQWLQKMNFYIEDDGHFYTDPFTEKVKQYTHSQVFDLYIEHLNNSSG